MLTMYSVPVNKCHRVYNPATATDKYVKITTGTNQSEALEFDDFCDATCMTCQSETQAMELKQCFETFQVWQLRHRSGHFSRISQLYDTTSSVARHALRSAHADRVPIGCRSGADWCFVSCSYPITFNQRNNPRMHQSAQHSMQGSAALHKDYCAGSTNLQVRSGLSVFMHDGSSCGADSVTGGGVLLVRNYDKLGTDGCVFDYSFGNRKNYYTLNISDVNGTAHYEGRSQIPASCIHPLRCHRTPRVAVPCRRHRAVSVLCP